MVTSKHEWLLVDYIIVVGSSIIKALLLAWVRMGCSHEHYSDPSEDATTVLKFLRLKLLQDLGKWQWSKLFLLLKTIIWAFSDGLVLKIPGFHCCGPDSISAQGSQKLCSKAKKKKSQNKQTKRIFWFSSLDQLFWFLDREEICLKFEAIYDRFNRRISHLSVEWIFYLLAYEFKHRNSVFL